ncbi:unnamed protein product, partial [Polarella glacialis]
LMESSGAEINISRHAIAGTELQPISIIGGVNQTLLAVVKLSSLLQDLAAQGRLVGEVWHRPARSRGQSRAPSRASSAARATSQTPSRVAASSRS